MAGRIAGRAQTVADDRWQDRLYILRNHITALLEHGPGTGSGQQAKTGARRQPPGTDIAVAGVINQPQNIVDQRLTGVDLRHQALQAAQLIAVEQRLYPIQTYPAIIT